MSYQNMDHADWVERQITGMQGASPWRASDRKKAAAGCGWYAAPDKLSSDQARIFDIIGMVAIGIYNAPVAWDSLDWHRGHGISLIQRGSGLSTFDFYQLTNMVFLCHEARIRGDIFTGRPAHASPVLSPTRGDREHRATASRTLTKHWQRSCAYLPPNHTDHLQAAGGGRRRIELHGRSDRAAARSRWQGQNDATGRDARWRDVLRSGPTATARCCGGNGVKCSRRSRSSPA